MPESLFAPRRGQMSEAFVTIAFLTLSGGFQDAYTFFTRGEVFANAQTGNIVLMSGHLFHGEWGQSLRYLPPILAFALGVLVTEQLRRRFQRLAGLHWRQWVLLFEMLLLAAVGFLPQSLNLPANVLVSFVCAMQVQAFRKVRGSACASTMCIGNLRSGVEALDAYLRTKDRNLLAAAARYVALMLCFALGAGLGSVISPWLGVRAIWLCLAWLSVSFGLMFLQELRETAEPA